MKWEYTTENVGGNYQIHDEIRRKLEIMGDDGWELVTILREGKHPRAHDGSQYESFTLFFKRPK